jgi:methylenetetrahydrofolate dehydrogenase (NADP+)/methenyltetrahydrofolate cyclohydrolase
MNQPIILDGLRVANEIKEDLKQRVEKLQKQGIQPCLATILVGDNPSSVTYVRMKVNTCEKLGIESLQYHLPEDTTTEELLEVIQSLNNDPKVNGILLQHPVPSHIDERKAFETIDITKDVDGVTSLGYGRVSFGMDGYPSCTPAAILEIMKYYNISASGKHAVVIGRSPILGKPVSQLLLNQNATITVCHSYTEDVAHHVKQADIIVAAVGKPNFVKGEWVKPGAVILDAGYNKGNIGDVDYESCFAKASAITPVPGGVGPVTIAKLMQHTVESAEKRMK